MPITGQHGSIIPCEYGSRFRNGKRIRPPTCGNRAHGVWKVGFIYFGKVSLRVMMLCAECGFKRMPNYRRIVELPSGEVITTKAVEFVELIASFSTTSKPPELAKPLSSLSGIIYTKTIQPALAPKRLRPLFKVECSECHMTYSVPARGKKCPNCEAHNKPEEG